MDYHPCNRMNKTSTGRSEAGQSSEEENVQRAEKPESCVHFGGSERRPIKFPYSTPRNSLAVQISDTARGR